MGPGKTYKQDFSGPDLFHCSYVDIPESTFGGMVTLNSTNSADYTYSIDISKDLSSFGLATNQIKYVWGPHGFFGKPSTWTGRRRFPGKIQQAISDLIKAHTKVASAYGDVQGAKETMKTAISRYNDWAATHNFVLAAQATKFATTELIDLIKLHWDIYEVAETPKKTTIENLKNVSQKALPLAVIGGVASGGDMTSAARAALEASGATIKVAQDTETMVKGLLKTLGTYSSTRILAYEDKSIELAQWLQEDGEKLNALTDQFGSVLAGLTVINQRLREYDDAQRAYLELLAKGDQIQAEREVFRSHSAQLIQGFRSRDAAFRIFRNEKLERYKTLFDLAARYALLAANAL